MADAHHDASERDERCGGETDFIGAQEETDNAIARGLHLTVGLNANAPAHVVHHENLLRLRKPKGSHGRPAYLREVSGDAPVPPSWPAIKTKSALPLATPAATVPTPTSTPTSFTLMLAFGLAFFKSKMSCAKSSMEKMS